MILLMVAFSLSACRTNSSSATADIQPASSSNNIAQQAVSQPEKSVQDTLPYKAPPARQEPTRTVDTPAEKPLGSTPTYAAQPESRPEAADPVRYQSVTLEWTTPLQRENGQLLGPNDLDGFIVEYTRQSAPETVAEDYVEGGKAVSYSMELPPGSYRFRVIAVDNKGLTSNPSDWVSADLG
jgi:hypothetical protein